MDNRRDSRRNDDGNQKVEWDTWIYKMGKQESPLESEFIEIVFPLSVIHLNIWW